MYLRKLLIFPVILLVVLVFVFPAGLKAEQTAEKKSPKAPKEAKEIKRERESLREEAKPGADAREIWEFITKTQPYAKYKIWPGKTAFYIYRGKEPHGALLTTYVNTKAFKAVERKKGAMPIGALIAQENYTPRKDLKFIAVMYKIKGFDPANRNWFYAKYAPGGKIEASGKITACISCHKTKAENDFMQAGPLK